MTILGAVFLPQLGPERLPVITRVAEDTGLEELWLWEDCFFAGGLTSAAVALSRTERLRVGVGLVPVPLRNAAVCAMEIATLLRLFPGRLEVGIGHGVQSWMRQVGVRSESPMTLLREYTTALRSLLHGDTVTTDGRYVRLDGVGLEWPPSHPPGLLVGATGPRTLRLSGEVADGTILAATTTPEDLRRARELIAQGHTAAGRTLPHPVTVYLLTAIGRDAGGRLEAEVRSEGGDATQVGVAGDAARVAEGVSRWIEAGADRVVLQPLADDDDPEGFVHFVARDLRPLLA